MPDAQLEKAPGVQKALTRFVQKNAALLEGKDGTLDFLGGWSSVLEGCVQTVPRTFMAVRVAASLPGWAAPALAPHPLRASLCMP